MDKKMNVTIVYIDDDKKMQEDAFLDDISDDVNEILYFEKSSEGLSYINENIDKNIIVILDWKFNSSLQQGDDVLKDIDGISVLVPVIVFTGASIDATETNKMFRDNAFAVFPKMLRLQR